MATRPSRKSNRFVVEFADADLPANLADRLENAVQRAALDILVDYDFDIDVEAILKFRPDWRGIWIDINKKQLAGR